MTNLDASKPTKRRRFTADEEFFLGLRLRRCVPGSKEQRMIIADEADFLCIDLTTAAIKRILAVAKKHHGQ